MAGEGSWLYYAVTLGFWYLLCNGETSFDLLEHTNRIHDNLLTNYKFKRLKRSRDLSNKVLLIPKSLSETDSLLQRGTIAASKFEETSHRNVNDRTSSKDLSSVGEVILANPQRKQPWKETDNSFYTLYKKEGQKGNQILVCGTGFYLRRRAVCERCKLCGKNEIEKVACSAFKNTVCRKEKKKLKLAARCLDLHKRRHHSDLFFKKFLKKVVSKTKLRFLQKCSPKLRKLLKKWQVAFNIEKQQPQRTLREGVTRRKKIKQEPDRVMANTTSNTLLDTDLRKSYGHELHEPAFDFPDSSYAEIPKGLENNEYSEPDDDSGTPYWIYIIVGCAVIALTLTTLLISLLMRRKMALKRSPRNRAEQRDRVALPAPQNFDTQRSGSTDRSKSTASTYLSKSSEESHAEECIELMPLRCNQKERKRPTVLEVFEESAVEVHADVEKAVPRVKMINTMKNNESSSSLLKSCVSSSNEDAEPHRSTGSRSIFNMLRDDENKLRGGNGEFHRKYVDVEYLHSDHHNVRKKPGHRYPSHSSDHRSSAYYNRHHSSHRSQNESNASSSTSHHSARSYISIPPTSPSENYIEVGSDNASLRSERSTPPIKMEWLTKSIKVDSRNELSNFQTTSETQTDSHLSSSTSKTVFGSPWQFGGTFNSRGGVMQSKDSAVSLTVVANAILKGEYVDIYGAVFTDTNEIRKKFDFPAEESLVTPVVEYNAGPNRRFQRPVCVQLPHSLYEDFDIESVTVYTFSVDEVGRVSQRVIPFKSRLNQDRDADGFWEKGPDGCSIQISTTHFSGYFCTSCESKFNLPSICTMVFGSHVQMDSTRREVRVILYIWDRRLTIKDYLEGFKKQECDVDRQLLTDMQVPLLDDASSNSHLIMKMETMGNESDRMSWRHITRPNTSSPMFKPLQKRKLSEIVYCCRQTDPIRIEWALENVPNQVPNTTFQCIIDIMHVPESTEDYEAALMENNEDLMRTFYVRDLKVTSSSSQDYKENPSWRGQKADFKKTLSQAMDMDQAQRVCEALGMPMKDIGNFRKKFTCEPSFQIELVEECLKRFGQERIIRQLPMVLQNLRLDHVLSKLGDEKILFQDLSEFEGVPETPYHSKVMPQPPTDRDFPRQEEVISESTHRKSPLYERSTSPAGRSSRRGGPSWQGYDASSSSSPRRPMLHQQGSDEVFEPANDGGRRERRSSQRSRGHDSRRHGSPPRDYEAYGDEQDDYVDISLLSQSSRENYSDRNVEVLNAKKSSSSGSDSVLRGSSMPSRANPVDERSSSLHSRSIGVSVLAQADSHDLHGRDREGSLDEFQSQTFKKEIAVQQNRNGYPEISDEDYVSNVGPQAFHHERGGSKSPSRDQGRRRRRQSKERSLSPDSECTYKKEVYGINTVV